MLEEHAFRAGLAEPELLHALDPGLAEHPAVLASGGLDPFAVGLYGCSEMLNEGFRKLVQTGVIWRKVHDDLGLMQRLADGTASNGDHGRLAREGEYLHGAFYLGSPEFYDWLRNLPEAERSAIGMRRISEINQLYGGNEALERLQRRDARFFNSCMIASALGAAASDALEDGRVVSGVGGLLECGGDGGAGTANRCDVPRSRVRAADPGLVRRRPPGLGGSRDLDMAVAGAAVADR